MKTQSRLLFLAATVIAGTSASADPLYSFDDGVLHFVGDIGIVYEDNILRTSTNKISDARFEFAPGLELQLSPDAAASTTIRYLHRFSIYEDESYLDDDFSEFTFKSTYDSGVMVVEGHASYIESYSTTVDFDNSTDDFGALILRDQIQVGGSLKKDISELTAFKVGAEYSDLSYKSDRFTDHSSYSVPVTLFYAVRPTLDLTAGARYRHTSTDTVVDYDDWYAYVGAVGELFSPVIYADLTVGYQRRNAKNSDADAKSPSYNLGLYYTGNAKATYYAKISRDYRTSSQNASAYAATDLQLGATYSLTQAVSVNGAIVFAENEYEQSNLAQDIMMVSLGATYSPNDYVSLRASYSYQDVDSGGPTPALYELNRSSYSNNIIRVTASLRY